MNHCIENNNDIEIDLNNIDNKLINRQLSPTKIDMGIAIDETIHTLMRQSVDMELITDMSHLSTNEN